MLKILLLNFYLFLRIAVLVRFLKRNSLWPLQHPVKGTKSCHRLDSAPSVG
jgi:hypothetical protein